MADPADELANCLNLFIYYYFLSEIAEIYCNGMLIDNVDILSFSSNSAILEELWYLRF